MSGRKAPEPELVPVFVVVGVRTSQGPGPGPKMLPPDEAARVIGAKLAVYGHQPPYGFDDGGADSATVTASKVFGGHSPRPKATQGRRIERQSPHRIEQHLCPVGPGRDSASFREKGTVVDMVPGSALEAAYGAGNLSPVIQPWDQRRCSDTCWSKAALGNLL